MGFCCGSFLESLGFKVRVMGLWVQEFMLHLHEL